MSQADDNSRTDLRIAHAITGRAAHHPFLAVGLKRRAAAAAKAVTVVPGVQMKAHQAGVSVMTGLQMAQTIDTLHHKRRGGRLLALVEPIEAVIADGKQINPLPIGGR